MTRALFRGGIAVAVVCCIGFTEAASAEVNIEQFLTEYQAHLKTIDHGLAELRATGLYAEELQVDGRIVNQSKLLVEFARGGTARLLRLRRADEAGNPSGGEVAAGRGPNRSFKVRRSAEGKAFSLGYIGPADKPIREYFETYDRWPDSATILQGQSISERLLNKSLVINRVESLDNRGGRQYRITFTQNKGERSRPSRGSWIVDADAGWVVTQCEISSVDNRGTPVRREATYRYERTGPKTYVPAYAEEILLSGSMRRKRSFTLNQLRPEPVPEVELGLAVFGLGYMETPPAPTVSPTMYLFGIAGLALAGSTAIKYKARKSHQLTT